MTTYLNVPFKDKTEAKAKGARWDGEERKWFVPVGRDLEPFTSWLPVDPTKLGSQEFTETGKGVPLSQLLAGVATAVSSKASVRLLAMVATRLPAGFPSPADDFSVKRHELPVRCSSSRMFSSGGAGGGTLIHSDR